MWRSVGSGLAGFLFGIFAGCKDTRQLTQPLGPLLLPPDQGVPSGIFPGAAEWCGFADYPGARGLYSECLYGASPLSWSLYATADATEDVIGFCAKAEGEIANTENNSLRVFRQEEEKDRLLSVVAFASRTTRTAVNTRPGQRRNHEHTRAQPGRCSPDAADL